MRVLSIDIGIKHLAFCIMERVNNTYDILFWNVINLMPDEDCDKICNGNNKNGTKCNRKSSMKFNRLCYCKNHCPKGGKQLPKKRKVKQFNYNQIGLAVINCVDELFDNHYDFGNVDKVVIELQLVRNPKMKFVSHCILTKLLDKYRGSVPINFIRASRKLQLPYDGPPIVCNVKSAYIKRKRKGVCMTKWYLNQLNISSEWKIFFEQCPSKRDDLADTFLFCLCVLK
jgi:hypothetical protein